MFWEEDEDKSIPYSVPDAITDISFAIKCKQLPIDHIYSLSTALAEKLPWINDEPNVGLHPIHVAESGNGWLRPESNEDAWLWPSRRTRFYMRIPKHRIDDMDALIDQTISIDGHPLTLGKHKLKPLINSSVIFARYIHSEIKESEDEFLARMAKEIYDLTQVKIRKMMCGKSHEINTPDGKLHTKHLMVADLDNDPSVKIQQAGLGDYRLLGCGLFQPHKGIKSLNSQE